ncbi:hypothetical protein SDC9_89464 [bioreactor metagenome]|uniref:SLH domain-containing protein n=1 Tax=bioreactor metagenome TaxID=1076179 RepID=A0A644ZVY2_9ZZZZ
MKKFVKLATALLMAVIIAAITILTAGAASYTSKADTLNKLGLFKGNSNGYDLDRESTRGEAATMLVRLLDKEKEALAESYTDPFTDIPSWSAHYVGYLYANGLANGTSATTFSPDGKCDAAMYTVFVLRALGYTEKNGDFTYTGALDFASKAGLVNASLANKNTFLRDDMVAISYTALSMHPKGTTTLTLLDQLVAAHAVSADAAKSYTKPESAKTVTPKLCVSTYTQGKSEIWAYGTENKKWEQIVKDRNVMLSSCLNKTAERAYFIDALGDDDPWQVFCCDLKTNQVTQLTSNTLSKGFITPGDDDTYYILEPSQNGGCGVSKLKESDGKYVESCAVNPDKDTDIVRFAVNGDQVISACYSMSEFNQNYSKSEDGKFVTNYRIVITDSKGNSKTIGTYPRKEIALMKVSHDKGKLLLGSIDKDGNNRFEIIDLSNGDILKTIEEKDICKSSDITRIKNLGIYAAWGDEDTLYFSAVYQGASPIDVDGLNVCCTGLYKMDLNNQQISRLDNFNNEIITDISVNDN